MKFAKYRVIHWFFDKQALEFLNIGIVVFNDDGEFMFKLIDESLLAKIKANFINKPVLLYTINHIRSFIETCKSESDLENVLKSEYQDNFKFSETKLFRPFESLESELDQLFYRYIEYKFDKKR